MVKLQIEEGENRRPFSTIKNKTKNIAECSISFSDDFCYVYITSDCIWNDPVGTAKMLVIELSWNGLYKPVVQYKTSASHQGKHWYKTMASHRVSSGIRLWQAIRVNSGLRLWQAIRVSSGIRLRQAIWWRKSKQEHKGRSSDISQSAIRLL